METPKLSGSDPLCSRQDDLISAMDRLGAKVAGSAEQMKDVCARMDSFIEVATALKRATERNYAHTAIQTMATRAARQSTAELRIASRLLGHELRSFKDFWRREMVAWRDEMRLLREQLVRSETALCRNTEACTQ